MLDSSTPGIDQTSGEHLVSLASLYPADDLPIQLPGEHVVAGRRELLDRLHQTHDLDERATLGLRLTRGRRNDKQYADGAFEPLAFVDEARRRREEEAGPQSMSERLDAFDLQVARFAL